MIPILISMHISNRFVIVYRIQIVIRMLKIYIMVLQVWIWGLLNGKIGSRLQYPFLFFIENYNPQFSWFYIMFQLPTPPLIRTPPVYLGPKGTFAIITNIVRKSKQKMTNRFINLFLTNTPTLYLLKYWTKIG